MISDLILFQVIAFLFLGGAIFGTVCGNRRVARYATFLPSMVGSAFTVLFSIVIMTGKPFSLSIPNTLPFFHLEILVDGISAFFLFMIGMVSFAVSL